MNPSKNPSALRSKSEITNALLTLMNQYKYEEISIKQIVLEAHIVRKIFYRNFTDKNDVLDSYIDSIMLKYTQALRQLQDCSITNVLDVIFEFCILNKDFLLILQKNHLMHLLLEKWNVFIPNMHNRIVDKESAFFKTCHSVNTDYVLAFNIGAVWNIIVMWIEHDMKESPEEIRDTIVTYLKSMQQFI